MSLLNKLFCVLLLSPSVVPASAQSEPSSIRFTPLVSGVEASFRGLAIRDSREAWITGSNGIVIRTTNSGRTWQRIAVPDSGNLDFRDVEAFEDGTVLLMSAGSGDASRLLRSKDGGRTWNTVLVNDEAKGFFDGMDFGQDGLMGFLFGDPVDGRLEIYRTSDAGATWARLPRNQRPHLQEGEYGFAASGTGIAVEGKTIWIATGGSVARVLRSNDEGATWKAADTTIRSGNQSSGVFSLAFINSTKGVAIGGNYAEPELDRNNVATTIDGGKTWLALPTVSMPHKACVRSLGGGRLIACGRTGVAFSPDAGTTWKAISSESYYTLAFDRESHTGYLAGKDGRIARFELLLTDE